MSLITTMIVAEKYGLRVNTAQLADIMKIAVSTINNQCSAGTFPIPTYVEGRNRWADYRDVAAYIDAGRARAIAEAGASLPA